MGSRMAMNLHGAGFKLKVWNRDRAKTKPFADKKIEVADSPAAAARGIGDGGSGATLKLINNMLGASLQAALAEGAQIAEAANLDRAATMEVLNEGASGSRVLKNKLPKMFNRDFTPQFALELMDKDVRYFLQLAAELDRPAPIASLVRSQFQAARRAALGKLDSCAVFLRAAGEK